MHPVYGFSDEPPSKKEQSNAPKLLLVKKTGVLLLKEVTVDGEKGLWPYFKDRDSGAEYKLIDWNDGFLDKLSKLKGGERCEVWGQVTRGANVSIIVKNFKILSTDETRSTYTGVIFTLISPEELTAMGVTDPAAFGQAWGEPDPKGEASRTGTIWGDMIKQADGSPRFMSHADAVAYCAGIGAQLPSRQDFERLGTMMGALRQDNGDYGLCDHYKSPRGFKPPTWFPNLSCTQDKPTYGRYFWSSTFRRSDPNDAFGFGDGCIVFGARAIANAYSVRCVLAGVQGI